MAPMALSDSKVNNDKSCSKTCLTNYETLKKQYDDLIFKLHETEFKAASYKRVLKREVGCKTYEFNMLKTEFEKVKQEKEGIDFKIERFENASKDLDKLLGSQITDNSKKGLGYHAVPPPHPLIYNALPKLDLSNSSLEEFQHPEFEGYGPKNNKNVSIGAPIIEDWESDNDDKRKPKSKVEKKIGVSKTVSPTVSKIEFVRPKQQEKPVRKPVKYAEMYRSQKPRGNQRNWNNQKSQQLGNDFVMHNKACYVCGSFDHLQYTCKQKRQLNGQREEKLVWNNARRVNHQNSPRITQPNPKRHMVPRKILTRSGPISLNTARQSYLNAVCCCCSRQVNTARPKAVVNVVRTNRVNVVKASACWVWRPVKHNSAPSFEII
ncbi:hypothetical protein Tco_0760855 [Tanacetum coccineum]